MKRFKEIFAEGEVIPFKPMRVKPPQVDLTHHQVRSQLNDIVSKDKNKWSHPDIGSGNEHSLTYLAHHIGRDARDFYSEDNPKLIDAFNARKRLSTTIVQKNKSAIRTHISDTIQNLERLHTNVQNGKFPSDGDKLKARRDVGLSLTHWENIRNTLPLD